MKRSILAVLLTVCIVLSFSSCSDSVSSASIYSEIPKIASGTELSGKESVVVAENDNLILSVEPNTATFSLTVKENNFVWNSVPQDLSEDTRAKPAVQNMMRGQLTIECGDMVNHIVSTYNSQVDSVDAGGLKVVHHENTGFTAMYNFPLIKVTIPVRYTLKEDYLEAEIVVGEIREEGDYKVLSADFLSAFGAGSTKEKGYVVVPDGSGAVIEFNNKKTAYNNLGIQVYGSDLSLSDKTVSGYSKAYMPIFGINKGDNGLLAVISRGDAHSTVNAMISEKTSSYNTVYPRFTLRDYKTVSIDRHSGVVENGGNSFIMFDTKPQVLNSVAVNYYPLTGDKADYSGMARRYGEYLIEEKGAEKKESSTPPLFLDIYGSINAEQKQLFSTVLKPVSLTTFEQAGEIVNALADGGVEQFNIQYKNWSDSGVNDEYTQEFDPLNSLGGEDELEKLMNLLKGKNAELYLASDIQKFKSGSNFFGLRPTVRQIDNAQLQISRVRRDNYSEDEDSRKYSFVAAYLLPEQMQKLVSAVPEKFGISLTGTEVYTDFGSDYSKRQQTALYLEQVAEKIKSKSAAELPDAFLVPSIDTAFGLGGQYGRYDIEDYGIPFYQIATEGILSYSLESINLSADKQETLLRSMEYGCGLMYTLTAKDSRIAAETQENALYNCDAEVWQSEILENYKKVNAVYSRIGSKLYCHKRLSGGVFMSDFDNGSIIVNYTDKPFLYKNITVEPKDYSVVR